MTEQEIRALIENAYTIFSRSPIPITGDLFVSLIRQIGDHPDFGIEQKAALLITAGLVYHEQAQNREPLLLDAPQQQIEHWR